MSDFRYIAVALLLFVTAANAQQTYLIESIKDAVTQLEVINASPVSADASAENCIILNDSSPLNEIQSETTKDAGTCYRPNNEPKSFTGNLLPGEHRLMTQDTYPRKSGILKGVGRGEETGHYLLRRLSDKGGKPNYQAILNLDFKDPSKGAPGIANFMLKKTKNCLDSMAPYMKGPNGENLSIKIITPSDKLAGLPKPGVKTIHVSYEASNYRGNAGRFGSNFSCDTIGHEVLHHLGLCDEYHEGVLADSKTGVQGDYSCRVVTAQPSYMRAIKFSFDAIIPQTNRCTCDENCKKVMADPAKKKIYLSMNAQDILVQESSLMGKICTEVEDKTRIDKTPQKTFELAEESGTKFKFYSYEVSSQKKYMTKMFMECKCPPKDATCSSILKTLQKPDPKATEIPLNAHCSSYEKGSTFTEEDPKRKQAGLIETNGKSFKYFVERSTFSEDTGPFKRRTFNCVCDPSKNEYCKKQMDQLKLLTKKQIPRTTCPEGTRPKIPEPTIGSNGDSRIEEDGKGSTLIISTAGGFEKSLLKPQHFYKILAGNCQGGAPAYEACQPYAYLPKGPLCNTKPAYCNDDEVYLNSGPGSGNQ